MWDIDYVCHQDQMVVSGFGDGKWSSVNCGGELRERLIISIRIQFSPIQVDAQSHQL